MATLVLAAAGNAILPGIGGAIGAAIGSMIDQAALSAMNGSAKLPDNIGARLSDTSVQASTYGKTIPVAYGRNRLAGNIIWSQPIKETVTRTTTDSSGGGKGGGGSASQTTVTYSYSVTMAIAICEGPISEVVRAWADSKALDAALTSANYTVYLGDDTQMPDATMESFLGTGNSPAYRGIAYVVITDFPLADYGNRIPNFTFEITRPVRPTPALEDKITSIHMIPGTGEFVYSTDITVKTGGQRLPDGSFANGGTSVDVNMHNFDNQADVLESLDQLKQTLPNLQWVGLIVSWFATSKHAGICQIKPKVEYRSSGTNTTPYDWSVAGLNRDTADLVLSNNNVLNYGGTPSDKSVVNLAVELKSRGYNVILYPFIPVDTNAQVGPPQEDNKPWRGRITPTSSGDVDYFFDSGSNAWNYDHFVNYYATLSVGGVALKDHIDAFVIGSELRGLTQYASSTGVFPAVTKLVALAVSVKTAVGSGVKVTYGADWSEYHNINGWYNLDPLWASTSIDMVGIDAYFPITPDLDQSNITYDVIQQYWEAGEGWDYFYDDSVNRDSFLVNNPITTTNTQTTVTLDLSGFVNHHLTIGQTFTLAGLTGPVGGISAANLNGVRTVLGVTDTTHVTFTAGAAATSSTTGGGSAGTIDKPKYYSGATYAWKNHQNWWNSTHTNPDASGTSWTAKMKPLWFTEFGFPSVDGCSNEPNVFVDPTSAETGYPRASRQRIDFGAQRIAIEATVDYLAARNALSGLSNLVPEAFLWTWDARPFPFWPDLINVWADGGLWETGHWVEGKLGISQLGQIVSLILQKVGLSTTDFDTSRLTDTVDGFYITSQISARQAIEQLQYAYFFDMVESDGLLKFVKRGQASVATITEANLIPLNGSSQGGSTGSNGASQIRETLSITRTQELDLPQEVSVVYTNRSNDYQAGTQISQRQVGNASNVITMSLPLVITDQLAKIIADQTLYTAWLGRNAFQFVLNPTYINLEPTDVITLIVNGVSHNIRVTDMKIGRFGIMTCNGVSEDISSYDFYTPPGTGVTTTTGSSTTSATTLTLLDMPPLPTDTDNQAIFRAAISPEGSGWSGSVIYRSDDGGVAGGNTYVALGSDNSPSTVGTCLTALGTGSPGIWDNLNTVEIFLQSGTLSSSTQAGVLNGANAAMIGDELIQFLTATIVGGNPQHYLLSGLLRGRCGTEWAVGGHAYGDQFIFIDTSLFRSPYAPNLIGQNRFYKGVTIGSTLGATVEQTFLYTGKTLKPFSPVDIAGTRSAPSTNDWTVNWTRRTRFGGEWLDGVDVPLNEATEAYQIDIMNGVTVVRTIAATSPTCVYTAAQQTTDFGSVQSSITVKIYQISAVVGRGYPGNKTLTG